jgi:hypothetical protein
MDIIQQMTEGAGKILAKLLTHKEEANEIIVEEATAGRQIGALIWALVESGEVAEAERLLFREMRENFDFDLYNTGLEFFAALNALPDERLNACGYRREQIAEGERTLFEILQSHCGLK